MLIFFELLGWLFCIVMFLILVIWFLQACDEHPFLIFLSAICIGMVVYSMINYYYPFLSDFQDIGAKIASVLSGGIGGLIIIFLAAIVDYVF